MLFFIKTLFIKSGKSIHKFNIQHFHQLIILTGRGGAITPYCAPTKIEIILLNAFTSRAHQIQYSIYLYIKKIKVSRINNFRHTDKFSSARIANQILLQTGFEEGKKAKINYKNGRLTIKLESNFINTDE